MDGTDNKRSSPSFSTESASAEADGKLSLTSVVDGHDLFWTGFALFSLYLYKDQSLQTFCASAACTNFKDIFEWMKIICLYVACKIRAKDK